MAYVEIMVNGVEFVVQAYNFSITDGIAYINKFNSNTYTLETFLAFKAWEYIGYVNPTHVDALSEQRKDLKVALTHIGDKILIADHFTMPNMETEPVWQLWSEEQVRNFLKTALKYAVVGSDEYIMLQSVYHKAAKKFGWKTNFEGV